MYHEVSPVKKFFTILGLIAGVAGLFMLLVVLYNSSQNYWIDRFWPKSDHESRPFTAVDPKEKPQDRQNTNSNGGASDNQDTQTQGSSVLSTILLKSPSGESAVFTFETNGVTTSGYIFVWSRVDRTGYDEVKDLSKDDPRKLKYEGQSLRGFTYSGTPEKGRVETSHLSNYLKDGEYRLYVCVYNSNQCGVKSNVVIKGY